MVLVVVAAPALAVSSQETASSLTGSAAPATGATAKPAEAMSIKLVEADLADVVHVFSQLTGLRTVICAGAGGTITAHHVEEPWYQILPTIVASSGAAYYLEDDIMIIAAPELIAAEKEVLRQKPSWEFDGDPINLCLKNASLHEVIGVFSDLTELPMEIEEDVACLVTGSDPTTVTVSFDGVQLSTERSDLIPLPPHDPFQVHLVTARLDFGRHGTAMAEVSFGGGFKEQVRTGLTAVAVELTRGRSMPQHHRLLAGWFVSGGSPLETCHVEKGEADVVMIMDDASRRYLDELYHNQQNTKGLTDRVPEVYLGRSENLWVMASRPRRWQQEKLSYEVFDVNGPYTIESGEITRQLAYLSPESTSGGALVSADVTESGEPGLVGEPLQLHGLRVSRKRFHPVHV